MVVGQLLITPMHCPDLYSAARPSRRNGLVTTWCDTEYLAYAEPLRRAGLSAADLVSLGLGTAKSPWVDARAGISATGFSRLVLYVGAFLTTDLWTSRPCLYLTLSVTWSQCNSGRARGGSRGCPGCPDTCPFDTVPFFEKNIFSKRAPIRRILGFCGSKGTQNGRFHAQDAHEPLCKIWRH